MPALSSVLKANYLFSTITGLGLVAASGPLEEWSGVARWILVAVGVGLVPFALFVKAVSRSLDSRLVRLVIAGDVGWVVGAAIVLVGYPDTMTSAGKWTLGLVSVVVADFALFQWFGLKKAAAEYARAN
jgi:hypothetical protein